VSAARGPVALVSLWFAWRLIVRWHPPVQREVSLPQHVQVWERALVASAAVAGGTVLLWVTGGLHPLSAGTVGLLLVVVAFGSGLLPPVAFRRLPWDVLGVGGGGLCLSVIVSESNLDTWILGILPIGGLGTTLVLVLMAVVAVTLSTVMSNIATANLLLPVAIAIPDVPGLPLVLIACAGRLTINHVADPRGSESADLGHPPTRRRRQRIGAELGDAALSVDQGVGASMHGVVTRDERMRVWDRRGDYEARLTPRDDVDGSAVVGKHRELSGLDGLTSLQHPMTDSEPADAMAGRRLVGPGCAVCQCDKQVVHARRRAYRTGRGLVAAEDQSCRSDRGCVRCVEVLAVDLGAFGLGRQCDP
jgi:hypothetical protein